MDFHEINRELDMEFLFERESLPYRMTRGVNGMQINAKHCPACGDSRYRTYLNAETGFGNCFVCGETFTKSVFLKELFHTDWRGAREKAIEIMREQGWRPKRTTTALVDNDTAVVLPYSTPLPLPDGSNLTYLDSRGITPEMTSYFHLRWCEFGFWGFKGEDGKLAQQSFDNRVIIPVYDLDGMLMTFQGRDLTGRSERKYLFPKMLPGTGRYLFNGQNVHLTSEIVIGEGAFDVIALKMAIDEDVALRHIVPVGTFGKHLSYGSTTGDDQVGRLRQLRNNGLKTVTIMWDGEEKALTAALDAGKLINSLGLVARIALLPPGKDPNEVLPEVVRQAYYEAKVWSAAVDIKWRLRNPYRGRQ